MAVVVSRGLAGALTIVQYTGPDGDVVIPDTINGLRVSTVGSQAFFGVLFNRSLKYLVEFPGGVGGSYTISDIVTNTGEAFVGNSLTSIVVNPANPIYASTNGVLFNKNFTWLCLTQVLRQPVIRCRTRSRPF
jgi:hypothetical protein